MPDFRPGFQHPPPIAVQRLIILSRHNRLLLKMKEIGLTWRLTETSSGPWGCCRPPGGLPEHWRPCPRWPGRSTRAGPRTSQRGRVWQTLIQSWLAFFDFGDSFTINKNLGNFHQRVFSLLTPMPGGDWGKKSLFHLRLAIPRSTDSEEVLEEKRGTTLSQRRKLVAATTQQLPLLAVNKLATSK